MRRPPAASRPRPSLKAALVLALLVLASCTEEGRDSPTATPGPDLSAAQAPPGLQDLGPAIAAAERYTAGLMARPGVVGTAVGLNPGGRPVVKVFLTSGDVQGIPEHLDQVPVVREVTGRFELRTDRSARARPAPIGFSVGHPSITAGTLGARVTDGTRVFILSNNHVLANTNNASLGDPILQPGAFDGGSQPGDVIGTLHDFQVISFSQNNLMDAAIASVNPADVSGSTPTTEGYGAPGTNPVEATPGMGVQKYGRTTGLTTGTVLETNVTVSVCFETRGPFCARAATFVNQFTIGDGSFSAGGDSGSLIVTGNSARSPVGLLFAGSSTRTIANPIGVVLTRFGVAIDPTVPDGEPGPDPDPTGPTASFTYSCVELACSFDANSSTAGDSPIESYSWDFGDGNSGSGPTTSNAYTSDGTYTVTLTVTDENGQTDSESQSVSVVSDDGNGVVTEDPVIDSFQFSKRTTGPWERVTVQWNVSHPEGALASVTSEFLNGSGGVMDSQTSSISGSSASGQHELRTRAGTPAEVRLTVVDAEGNTTSKTEPY